jgi:hypothetical protein
MKKIKLIIILIAVLLPVSVLWGNNFTDCVDFKTDLESVNNPETAESVSKDGRIIILEGISADLETKETPEGPYYSLILLGGKWDGNEKVESYSCRIIFKGKYWMDFFNPDSENAKPEYGTHLLLAVKITGYDKEEKYPVAEAVDLRILY